MWSLSSHCWCGFYKQQVRELRNSFSFPILAFQLTQRKLDENGSRVGKTDDCIIRMIWLKYQRRQNIKGSNSDPSSASDSLHSSNQADDLRFSFSLSVLSGKKKCCMKLAIAFSPLPFSTSDSKNYFCGISDSWDLCLWGENNVPWGIFLSHS